MAPSRGEEGGELSGGGGEEGAEEQEMVSGEEGSSSYASSYDASSSEEVERNWKQNALVAAKLWFAGFQDACCLNRAYLCCRRCVLGGVPRKGFVASDQGFMGFSGPCF